MTTKARKYCCQFLLVFFVYTKSYAQTGLCPSNLNFEQGNFNGWTLDTGHVRIIGGVNTVIWGPAAAPIPNRHTIISSLTAGTDPYGNFPEMCPNGSNYSVKLGNAQVGAEAERISYVYTIPSSLSLFSMLFHYAIVLQDPRHTTEQQPRFKARIIDVATSNLIACVNFDFISSATLPGFQVSPTNPTVVYKDWTPISINLNAYIGRTIRIEFITSDCTPGGHFGYAYLDVNTNCNGVISGNFICPGDTSLTLSAPYGFQSYKWYSDPTFTTILSTTQTLYLNPVPLAGSVYPVIVEPYTGFGCVDTLYALIQVGAKPAANAGSDAVICQGNQIQIGAPPNPIYTYEWAPAGQVSNPTAPDPFAWTLGPNPEQFIVKTTDILTGCVAYDTTIISTERVDTALLLTDKNDYCIGDPQKGTLSVSTSLNAVQWYDNTTPLPGATGFSFTPTVSGNYWAQVTQGACIDSTATIIFSVRPLPVPSFIVDDDTGCVTSNSFLYTNTSVAPDGASLTHLWKFSDGTTQSMTDATKSFPAVGSYNVKLVTTSSFGCADSTGFTTVHVLPNGKANFNWDSICTTRPVKFYNLSNEQGSTQVNYNWSFNNGGPGASIKDPPLVVYNTPGQTDVTLILTALGCENFPDSVVKRVQVNIQKPGTTYKTITVPQGSSQWVHVRDTIGNIYRWRPTMQLSSYDTRYTEFFATGDDVKYLIDISDIHTCVTTDTMQMLVLKKPGFYLPTAFTPGHDGLNDILRPYLIGMKGLKSFSVFDRWGKRVFFTTTYGKGWDGKLNGVDLGTNVYVWVLEFYNAANKVQMEKGTVTLIR
jgi:gliding motility-associated-like protein